MIINQDKEGEKMFHTHSILRLFSIFVIVAWLSPLLSQAVSVITEAKTTGDPDILTDDLSLMVEPMTVAELKVEVEAWFQLLKAKVQEISDFELAAKRKHRALEKQKEAAEQLEEAKEAMKEAEEAKKKQEEEEKKLKKEKSKEGGTTETKKEAEEKAEEAKTETEEKSKEAAKELEEAQKKLEEAAKTEKDLKKDETVKKVVDEAQKEQKKEGKDVKDDKDIKKLQKGLDKAKDGTKTKEGEEVIDEAVKELEDTLESAKDLKEKMLEKSNKLREERTALIDRLNIVLKEYEEKGGDEKAIKQYKDYINSVKAVVELDDIDVKDTKGLWVRIQGWLKSDEGGLRWLINISKFIGILIVSILISFVLSNVVVKALQNRSSELMRSFLQKTIKNIGIILGLLLGLSALEVNLGPILALVGGASFILAFALQSNLGNFASGIMIMLYKPFDVGDEVVVNGEWSYIDSITLANTKLLGFSGELITVPNNTVWNSQIINYTHTDTRRGKIKLRLGFKEDIDRVSEILLDILKSNSLITKHRVNIRTIDEDCVTLNVSYWSKVPDYWTVWVDVQTTIQKRFLQEGVEFAMPRQDIRISKNDEN